jgi:transposase-like protein
MKGKPVPLELRNKIITSIVEDGVPVSTLASEYSINTKTIYTWLRASNISSTSDYDSQKLMLEVSRLKRDKQDLIDLIGRLTIDVDKLNKKKR